MVTIAGLQSIHFCMQTTLVRRPINIAPILGERGYGANVEPFLQVGGEAMIGSIHHDLFDQLFLVNYFKCRNPTTQSLLG